MIRKSIVANPFLEDEPQSPTIYKIYAYRWVVLVVFLIACINNVMMWLTFAPLQTQLVDLYNLSLTEVNFGTTQISNIVYGPACFVTNWIIERFGFRTGVIIGTIMTSGGLWLRIFCPSGFAWIFAGQAVASCAQSFFYGTGQKVSALWFPDKERAFATTLIMGLMPVGNAIGPLLPNFLVDLNATGSVLMGQIQEMLFITALIGSGVLVIVVFLFREKPPTPPSRAAEIPRYSYAKSLKGAFTNPNLMWALFTQSFFAGVSIAFGSVIEPILIPFGVSASQVAYLLSISVFSGFILNLFTSYLVAKTKKYKFWLFFFSFISNFFVAGIIFFANSGSSYLLCLLALLVIGVGTAALPATFEFFVEISFPVAEEVPGSLYTLGYNFLGAMIALWITNIMADGTPGESVEALYVTMVSGVISICGFLFVKEDLRRTKAEKGEGRNSKIDPEGLDSAETNESRDVKNISG